MRISFKATTPPNGTHWGIPFTPLSRNRLTPLDLQFGQINLDSRPCDKKQSRDMDGTPPLESQEITFCITTCSATRPRIAFNPPSRCSSGNGGSFFSAPLAQVKIIFIPLVHQKDKGMSAIERIEGYCCEVTPEQWNELVNVADEVGCPVGIRSRREGPNSIHRYVECFNNELYDVIALTIGGKRDSIPFDSFLAKLRGDAEQWTPKAGEMVEVMRRGEDWEIAKFICIDSEHSKDWLLCYLPNICEYHAFEVGRIRPARPRYTKAEAEQMLNAIITD